MESIVRHLTKGFGKVHYNQVCLVDPAKVVDGIDGGVEFM